MPVTHGPFTTAIRGWELGGTALPTVALRLFLITLAYSCDLGMEGVNTVRAMHIVSFGSNHAQASCQAPPLTRMD